MSLLYNRKAYVVFGPKHELSLSETGYVTSGVSLLGGGSALNVNQVGFPFIHFTEPPKEDNRGFKDLRVAFNIKKTLEGTENKAEIDIYNVSEDSHKLLQKYKETSVVQLSVGYGEARDLLFIGDIENSSYYREGADWILKITAKDGQEIIQDTLINKSYREGFTLKNMLLDMIDSSKIIPEFAAKKARKWVVENVDNDKKTENGNSMTGKWMDKMNQVLEELGAIMSIQDNTAQIIWVNSNTKDDIVVISPSSGLIGSPAEKGSEEGIEFQCLLIPIIRPGGLIRLKSRSISDYFRIDSIIYKGDTHGNDWMCNCQGTIPTNIVTDLTEIEYYKSDTVEGQIEPLEPSLVF